MTELDLPFHIMTDIETMALDNNNSLILSIGLQGFQLGGPEPQLSDLRPQTIYPSLEEQLMLGRIADAKTQSWWGSQSGPARDDWMNVNERVSVINALDMIDQIFQGVELDGFWANGVMFDLGNLEGLYKSKNRKVPWFYSTVRDMRTTRKMMPEVRTVTTDLSKLVAHKAADDCILQIYDTWSRVPALPGVGFKTAAGGMERMVEGS